MSNSFFVILPSNTPGFVGNKTNKFKVHLPKKLVFDGPGWMLGDCRDTGEAIRSGFICAMVASSGSECQGVASFLLSSSNGECIMACLKHERDKKEREEEDKRRQQREEQLRKQREEQQEEAARRAAEKANEKIIRQRKQQEKEQEKARKSEADRVAKEKKTEKERLAKEEEERLAKKAEDERLANVKKEVERLAREKKKAEDERLARAKKEKEEKKAEEDRLSQVKTARVGVAKRAEAVAWRLHATLVHGKDPTPDVHYLHEKDDYHFVNAVHKYIVRHPELPWDSPEFNPSANIQQNIAEFREIFESEVVSTKIYELKTREEKNELIELLAYVFGYEQQQEIHNEDQAKYAVDLAGGVSHLCIYLNSGIIESMIFGNTFANLLQVIAVEGASGSVVEKDFQSPLFHKIVAREVDVLDVEIRTLTGRWQSEGLEPGAAHELLGEAARGGDRPREREGMKTLLDKGVFFVTEGQREKRRGGRCLFHIHPITSYIDLSKVVCVHHGVQSQKRSQKTE
ncbi:hypothetical protein niasHT_037230 [Heterodera trifolii]|uniref:Uncharacterized protein n=1 Tax=Heterodera trifolii TaxID=157864 RepID=A0ABD2IDB3_9BILA